MYKSRTLVAGMPALIVSVAFVAPFYFSRRAITPGTDGALKVPATHDMGQHLAMAQDFDKVLRSGELYPRWLPDVNNGYGLAWTNYYPPGLYYAMSLVNILVRDWTVTLFVVCVLGLAVSGLSFYFLARLFYGAGASAIAALFYMVTPYHILEIYWRGAMPELLGFALLPAIFYAAFKVGTRGNARSLVDLGLLQGAYLLTHFPVGYLTCLVLTYYAVIRAIRERDWRIVGRIATGLAIAVILASIYWIPAALETRYATNPFSSIFPYHRSYITLLEGDGFTELINNSFALLGVALIAAIWILHSMSDLTTTSVSVARHEAKTDRHTYIWVLIAITTLLMSTSFSIYVSKLIPKIDVISFAWRWLVISTFFGSLVIAAAADRLTVVASLRSRKPWLHFGAVSLAIALNIGFTVAGVIIPALSQSDMDWPASRLELGFIPSGATHPKDMPDTPLVMVLPPSGADVQVVRWQPASREINVSIPQAVALRLRTYNFPGWEARVDGQPAEMLNDVNGAQIVNVPAGEHRVEVVFGDTPARKLGAALSGLGLLVVCGLLCFEVVMRRRVSRRKAERQEPPTIERSSSAEG